MTATDTPSTTAASWPPGLPRSLDYPQVPVGSILRAAVRRWGDREAFIDHDVPLTFTELGARAHAVAGWLADRAARRLPAPAGNALGVILALGASSARRRRPGIRALCGRGSAW